MTACVFAGPSFARLPPGLTAGIELKGPARQGDVYLAARSGAPIIGLIDGYFDSVPSVWHKEILWALTHGVHVYGSSSIGALRAVELAPFGMQGIGRVFKFFRDGILQDDDEVALIHGPAETGFMPVSEAMVNVRVTLERATSEAVITPEVERILIRAAKGIFYKDRTYPSVISSALQQAPAGFDHAHLSDWLRHNRVDQKQRDALELIGTIQAHLDHGVSPFTPRFSFHLTAFWDDAQRCLDNPAKRVRSSANSYPHSAALPARCRNPHANRHPLPRANYNLPSS